MMTMYSAYVEVETHRLDAERALAQLGDPDSIVDISDSGWVSARIRVDESTIALAAVIVAALAEQVLGAALIMVEIMSEAEFTAQET